jgi:integrase
MNINFYLKDPKTPFDTYILCSIVIDRKRARKSTGLRIEPRNWDSKKQSAKSKPEVPHQHINDFLSHVKRDAILIENEYMNGGLQLTPSRFFEELWNKGTEELDLLSFAQQWIEDKKGLSDSTISYYRDALRALSLFCEEKSKTTDFQLINDKWYEDFNAHLKGRGNTPATRKQYRQFFRTIFNEARKKGNHTNEISKKLRDPIPPSFKVALTDKEVTELYNLNLPNERMDRIRDLFVLGCRTGLRYSDWNSTNLPTDSRFVTVATKKTKRATRIPLHPEAKAILQKHNGTISTAIYQTDRLRLESLMKLAKEHIPSLSKVVEVPVGSKIERKERWELIKTHSARRTFASILYRHREELGITDVDIMSITAHTSKDSFYKYIVPDEEKAQLAVYEFFNRKK